MKISDKVVCVRDLSSFRLEYPEVKQWPIKGEIYTIRGFAYEGLLLYELVNPPHKYHEGYGEPSFCVNFFRPIDYSAGESICEEIEKSFSEQLEPAFV